MTEEQKRAGRLCGNSADERLTALKERLAMHAAGQLPPVRPTDYVNNHIHTIYSFSPYSPSGAAYTAWASGLTTAGIMDHDSVSGAREFIQAGQLAGIAATVGFECRCGMTGTPFEGQRLNNPDQKGVAYVACHGIPNQKLDEAGRWLAPWRERRNVRNRAMTERINALTGDAALALDFDRDVFPLSMAPEGGSVTERHLLYALAKKIIAACGKGEAVSALLLDKFGMEVTGKNRDRLLDAGDEDYAYSLLGVLKGGLVESFYIDARDECPPVAEFVRFAAGIGAIPAYAYLGDVGDSVTGDKKAQAFEDAFLDELMAWLAKIGFLAVTYMPTRNTPAQLARLIGLCEKYGLFQISGEDINSPAQSFICEALTQPAYSHLIQSTWALIGHEKAAVQNPEDGMFTPKTLDAMPALEKRTEHFAAIGRGEVNTKGCAQ